MKVHPWPPLVAIILLGFQFPLTAPAWGDVKSGVEAYHSGDYEVAYGDLSTAAGRGDATAQYLVGKMYSRGEAVPKDPQAANRWFRMAAEQGEARAQFSLGLRHAKGYGVPRNHVKALVWLNLAAAQDIEAAARTRDRLLSHMSPEQLAAARTQSRLTSERIATGYFAAIHRQTAWNTGVPRGARN